MTGREILASFGEDVPRRVPSLSGRLERTCTVVVAGMPLPARCRTGPDAVRLRVDAPILFEPGAQATVDGRPVRLLAVLDSLDPSARTRLRRTLERGELPRSESNAGGAPCARTEPRDEPPGRRGALSPAARALVKELVDRERRAPEELHARRIDESGRSQILAELVRAGVVVKLAGGRLIAREALLDKVDDLRRAGSITSRDAAERWGCSHGRAKAVLRALEHQARLRRRGSFYTVPPRSAEEVRNA